MTGSGPTSNTFYPSCVVNLRLRFDERLTFNVQGAARLGYTTEEIAARAASPDAPSGLPLFLRNSNDGNTYVNARIPKKASIELPAYRDCGKFSLTFDYRDIPIDPRLLRGAGVEIYLDAVSARNFSSGVTDAAPEQGERVSVITRAGRMSQLVQSIDNLAMVGTIDSWRVAHTNKGSEISVEGRDLRAILMQSPVDPAILKKLDLNQDIGKVVRDLVASHPMGGKMSIYTVPAEEWYPDGRIPSPADKNKLTRVNLSADGTKAKASPGAQADKINLWDLITQYCSLVGAVPYFKGETLIVAPARSLYAQLAARPKHRHRPGERSTGVRTPFANSAVRDVGESTGLAWRRLVYGRNIDEMNFERKFNGFVARTVEAVSLDTSSANRGAGRLLIARWPADKGTPSVPAAANFSALADNPEEAAVSQVSPGGETGLKDVVRISVPGISDKKRLTQIAQDLYEELGRGEQGGSVKTCDLTAFGGTNEDPDLLRLRPGDMMELSVDAGPLDSRFPQRSPLNDEQRQSEGELINEIEQRLGDHDLAVAVVASSRNLVSGLQNYFRVSNVKFDWDVTRGVAISFDFQNYLEARNAVTPVAKPVNAQGRTVSTGQNVPRRYVRPRRPTR